MSTTRRLWGPRRAVTVSVVLHVSAFVAFAFAVEPPPAVAPTVLTMLPLAEPEPELSTESLPRTTFAEPPSVNDPVIDDVETALPDIFREPVPDIVDVVAIVSPDTYANVRLHAGERRPASARVSGGGEGPGVQRGAPPLVAAPSVPDAPALATASAVGPTRPPSFATAPEIPAYPELARRRRWEGRVRLRISVDATGAVSDIAVVTSSGREVLDDAAIAGARAWRLLPALDHGTPIAATFEKSIEFSLLD